jgi:hypothetical protein
MVKLKGLKETTHGSRVQSYRFRVKGLMACNMSLGSGLRAKG